MPSELQKTFKSFLALSGKTFTDTIEEYNQKYCDSTTVSNINNKLARETIKYSEMQKLANILGYDVQWVKRDE